MTRVLLQWSLFMCTWKLIIFFVSLKTRELIKKLVDTKSNANDNKKMVLHALKSHIPDRTSVYNYIKYLPDHLDEGAVKNFLKEMSE